MEGLSNFSKKIEKSYDPYLEELWGEYDFPGRPPYEGSDAEKRLRQVCSQYCTFLTEQTGQNQKALKLYDSERRKLHNQIAVMVVGKQRSGMDREQAEHIANFAFELTKGYKMSESDKYERKNRDLN